MKSTRKVWAIAALLLSAAAVLHAGNNPGKGSSYFVYVGTYTGPTSKGIYVFRFDSATGQATEPVLAAETKNPSFLAAQPAGHFLYAVNEVSDFEGKKSGAVSAFAIEVNGNLKSLNEVPSQGAGPCHLSLDKTGKYVFVANYDSGSIAAFPIGSDGKLGQPTATIQHSGHGPDPERQEGPHAHEILPSPDNHFVVASDLGLDELLSYKFNARNGTLTANTPAYAKTEDASGPRHFAFTPNGKYVYVLEEMRSAVSGFAYDAGSGRLTHIQTISSLPADFGGHKEAAEIAVHPSGKFLYASNRGHDSIAVFAIAPDGKLSNIEYVPTGGKTPRGFALDPTGSNLLVGNQESDSIAVFRIDPATGRLKMSGPGIQVPSPVSIELVRER
jgi:6-phosphogluconolactonase